MPLSAVTGAEVIHTSGRHSASGPLRGRQRTDHHLLDLFGYQIAWATPWRLCHPRALPACEEHPDRPRAIADSRDHAPRSADMHLLVAFGTERTDPNPLAATSETHSRDLLTPARLEPYVTDAQVTSGHQRADGWLVPETGPVERDWFRLAATPAGPLQDGWRVSLRGLGRRGRAAGRCDLAAESQPGQTRAMKVLHAAQVFDGTAFLGPGSVFVDGASIVGVERGHPDPPSGADMVSYGGTLLPGLVDSHVHLVSNGDIGSLERAGSATAEELDAAIQASLAAEVAGGVTTVQDLGDRGYRTLALGAEPGLPRVLAAGPP